MHIFYCARESQSTFSGRDKADENAEDRLEVLAKEKGVKLDLSEPQADTVRSMLIEPHSGHLRLSCLVLLMVERSVS